MRFGRVAVAEAEGCYLAHTLFSGPGTIRKGTLLTRAILEAIAAAGVNDLVAARLDPGDVHEDEAARRIAGSLSGPTVAAEPPATGRVNLHAERAGVVIADAEASGDLTRLDPAITVATLPAFAPVAAGRMVATLKIIPYAAAEASVRAAEELARRAAPLRIQPFRPFRVGLVATELPSVKRPVMEKTRRVLDERLAKAGAAVATELRVPHDAAPLGAALRRLRDGGHDLLVVFGASAVVDADDVVPAGIAEAGGAVRHIGMPVDPGNLLVLGDLDGAAVVGAPGCARSPRENGFDWVLNRLLAGVDVTPQDITALGVGGLLMEIATRPSPRLAEGLPRVAAVVLAAGRSQRTGGPNKLLATIDGRPLVRIAAEAALASRAASVLVVTGGNEAAVEQALTGLAVTTVHNPDYAAGLSTSLRAGIAALPVDIDAAVVLLADMPFVTGATVDSLIAAYQPAAGSLVVAASHRGQQGNPVLWDRRYFADLCAQSGDRGARALAAANADAIVKVECGPEVLRDLDTREALEGAGAVLPEGGAPVAGARMAASVEGG